MSESTPGPAQAPPPPPVNPPPPAKGRALGWFFAISGSIVLILTLGCILAFTGGGGGAAEIGVIAFICGLPTLILGGVFLWLGSRRLKR